MPELRVLLLEAYPQLLNCSGHGQTVQQMLSQLQLHGFDSIRHIGCAQVTLLIKLYAVLHIQCIL